MSFPDGEDYYAILGARKTASQDEIESLYKSLAKQHHPDRGGDAEEMKAINAAYRVLGNADTRRLYDSQIPVSDDALPPVVPPLSPPASTTARYCIWSINWRIAPSVGRTNVSFLSQNLFHQIHVAILLSAVLVVILGVRKLHAAMVFARKSVAPSHSLRRYVWVQELGFWFIVCGGAYGIYQLMSSI